MFAKLFIWLIIAGIYIWNAGAVEEKPIEALPPGIPTCENITTSVGDCMRNAFNILVKATKNGIPELNIPPNDPLTVDKMKIDFSNEILRGKAIARSVVVYGFSDCTMAELKFQRNETIVRMDAKTLCPKLQINCEYRAKMTVNNAKILSAGVFNFTVSDMEGVSEHFSEVEEKNNQTFLRQIKVNFVPKLGHLKMNATGLVPEPALNDALLEVLNSNWQTVAMSTSPGVKSTVVPILMKISNAVLSHIPLNVNQIPASS